MSAATPLLAGASLAEHLGAPWYAAYVIVPASRWRRLLWREDADALAVNIRLAETLGATVVVVKASDTAQGLIALAARENITHVIFGHQAGSGPILSAGSTVARFCRGARGVEVQVVEIEPPAKTAAPHVARLRIGLVIPAALCILVAAGLLVFREPWPLSLGAAIAVAASWCWWLERQKR
jgi:K+-sensing histidine kinase KdpD